MQAKARHVHVRCRSPICYFDYTYRADGQVTRVDREDGAHVYYEYDGNNRLTAQDWYSGGACIYAFAYDYDAGGNRTYDSFNGVETYYEYSPADELLRKHVLPADEWAYYAYDANGSLVRLHKPAAGECTYFAYNDVPLVESIRYPDGSMNYFHYDGQMRRYAVEDSTGMHYFYHDGLNPLSKVNAADEVVASYANGPSRVAGNGTLISIKQDAVSIPCFDQVGTLFAAVDADGASVLAREWDAFGRNLGKTGSLDTDFGYQTNWRELRDWPEADKWHLSPTRIEAAEDGRFTQRDAAGYGDGLNLYEYAQGSPTLFRDPSGRNGEMYPRGEPYPSQQEVGYARQRLREAGHWQNGPNDDDPDWQTVERDRERQDKWQEFKRQNPEQARRLSAEPKKYRPPGLSLRTLWREFISSLGGQDTQVEYGIGRLHGVVQVKCCDEKNREHIVILKKRCWGFAAGVAASGHCLRNIKGANCPSAYANWFWEYSGGLALVAITYERGSDTTDEKRVSGLGLSVGPAIPIQIMRCHYTIVNDRVVPG